MSSSSESSQSLLQGLLYTLRAVVEFVHTVLLLVSDLVFLEITDTVAGFGMGVDFTPAKDVGSLEGKVILVTGGIVTRPR